MKVLVFGYSNDSDRYSNMAARLLKEHKHEVVTINPRLEDELSRINTIYDTLTLYVSSTVSDKFTEILLKSKPRRVIFNPGTENNNLQKKFEAMGTQVIIGCTLVMLRTDQFDE